MIDFEIFGGKLHEICREKTGDIWGRKGSEYLGKGLMLCSGSKEGV